MQLLEVSVAVRPLQWSLGVKGLANLMHKILFYNKFIIYLYMFRALLCSSSGGQNCIIQHQLEWNVCSCLTQIYLMLGVYIVLLHKVQLRVSAFNNTIFRLYTNAQKVVMTVLYSIWYRHTCRWPSRSTFPSQPAHRTATYRCHDTRCCIIQL